MRRYLVMAVLALVAGVVVWLLFRSVEAAAGAALGGLGLGASRVRQKPSQPTLTDQAQLDIDKIEADAQDEQDTIDKGEQDAIDKAKAKADAAATGDDLDDDASRWNERMRDR